MFSAFGIGFSDIADSFVEVLNGTDAAAIQTAADELLKQARRGMKAEGFDLDNCELSAALVTGEGEDRQSTASRATTQRPRKTASAS